MEERLDALEAAVEVLARALETLQPKKPTLQEQSEAFLRRIHGGG